MREWRHNFITSALDGGEWSSSHTSPFISREIEFPVLIGYKTISRACLDTLEKRNSLYLPRIEL
jgi:hypothetical protein